MLDPADRKFRPLHESRKHNARSRRIAKMMSKQNCFKRIPEDSADSPSKKKEETGPGGWKLFQKDGNSLEGWKTCPSQ